MDRLLSDMDWSVLRGQKLVLAHITEGTFTTEEQADAASAMVSLIDRLQILAHFRGYAAYDSSVQLLESNVQ